MSDEYDEELERITRRKMIEYMREYMRRLEERDKAGRERVEDIFEKAKFLFKSDAFQYLLSIRKRNPDIAFKVLNTIVYLIARGLLAYPVDALTVEVIEKKLEGYKGRIYIERRGELKEFGESLREE